MFRVVKNLVLGIVIGLFLVVAAAITMGIIYGDEVKSYVVGEMKKNLNIEINIGDINFSFLKKFPKATIELKDVLARPTKNFKLQCCDSISKDTLFYAKQLFLQFNVFDVLNKNYVLKDIHLKKGKVCILINKNGDVNYKFWKDSDKHDKDTFKVNLQNVLLTDVDVVFLNKPKEFFLSVYGNKIDFSGDLSLDNFFMDIIADAHVNKLSIDSVNYLYQKDVALETQISVIKDVFTIQEGELETENMKFDVSGSINAKKTTVLDLRIKGKDIDIPTFIRVLPHSFQRYTTEYKIDGMLLFDAHLFGKTDKFNSPNFQLKFEVKDGFFNQIESSINLTNVDVEGVFNNGKLHRQESFSLDLKKYNFKIGNNSINGKCKIANFQNPVFETTNSANLVLSELKEFFKIDTLSKLDGNIKTDFALSGNLNLKQPFNKKQMAFWLLSGNASLKNVVVKFKNDSFEYKNINGDVVLGNDLILKSLTVTVPGTNVKIDGTLQNTIKYLLLPNENIMIVTELSADVMDYDVLMSNFSKGKNNSKASQKSFLLLFPEHLFFDAKLNINKFKFQNFNAETIKGMLTYKPKMFVLKSAVIHTMDGAMSCNGAAIQQVNNDLLVQMQASLLNIDIQKLFYSFNSFGQKTLQDKHIRGIVSGNIAFSSTWKNDLTVYQDKIFAEGNLSIVNGELINFEPMMGLSKYIDVTELKDIKFATLKNTIFIKDRMITIPLMDIESNALNLSLSGTHTFDNYFDYRVKVALTDVLFNKAKKSKKENEEFGVVEEDKSGRTNIYLSIIGDMSNYKVKYDRKKAREDFIVKINNEKKTVKSILNQEFGLFKKDTLSTIQQNFEINQNKVKVEWTDETEEEKTSLDDDESNNTTVNDNATVKDNKTIKSDKTNTEEDDKPKVQWDE